MDPMRFLLPLLLLGAGLGRLAAQDAPPPEVDRALRGRIEKFYQAHVDGKFSAAFALVAEENRDAFLDGEKPRYLSCQVDSLKYSENFTRALAVVLCEREVKFAGFQAAEKVKMPVTSTWKLAGGEWYWYVDRSSGQASPFGFLSAAPPKPGNAAQGNAAPADKVAPVTQVVSRVDADKTEVRLAKSSAGTGEVTFTNRMGGWVTLTPDAISLTGLSAKVEPKDIAPGSTAKLVLHYEPQPSAPAPEWVNVGVAVLPMGQVINIRVAFNAPEKAAAADPKPAAVKKPAKAAVRKRK